MALLMSALCQPTPAVDWYVATNGTGPGTNGWANATNSLQGAIDKSAASDIILVSNGLYASGGVTNYPAGSIITNRIAIWKSVTGRSKDNNPPNTITKGAWDPATTNGPAAVRCVYMTSNSALIGFTITNGATASSQSVSHHDITGGGIMCFEVITPVISNCLITGNAAYGGGGATYHGGGGVWYGSLYNCSLVGNVGGPICYGGAAGFSYLYNCDLTGNSSAYQGGACGYGCVLSNCTITANTAAQGCGGTYWSCVLYNCTVSGNRATGGAGGVYSSTLYNCMLSNNVATQTGGGIQGGTLYNCLLIGNSAGYGGGAYGCVLYNCTVVGNYAAFSGSGLGGGGVNNCTLSNCVVYFNSSADAQSNWTGSAFAYSCTSSNAPGVGNITGDPMFVDKGLGFGTNHVAGNYRLSARSQCVNAGTNLFWMTNGSVTSKDLDNRQRVRYGTADMGAFENIRAGTIYGIH